MTHEVDTLVVHGHLFTMAGNGVGYVPDGAVAVAGRHIVDVGPASVLVQRHPTAETIDAKGCAILPGLIDGHIHTRWAVVRGVAQDVAHWMQRALSPYSKHLDPAASLAGTRLNVLEGLRAGTTTFVDYVNPLPGWAEFYREVGVRARLTPTANAMPVTGMAGLRVGDLYPFDEALGRQRIEESVRFARDWNGVDHGRISVMLGPQSPDTLPREHLLEVKRIAEREGLMIHMHVAQGDREIDQMLKRYGVRTPEFLDRLGLLDSQLLAIHLTEASDEETAMIARRGANMVVCSGSIGIIDGIVPPARAFREAGGMVALGSDQAAGNNCSNIFNEMRLTALFNKIKFRDPTVMPAWEVLRMATVEGARAIGLGDQIGSIEPGKEADLILVDLSALNLTPVLDEPVRNIVPNLVYAAGGHEVKTVMVAGRVLLRNGTIVTVDEAGIRADAQRHGESVARRVAADPLVESMDLMAAMRSGLL